MVLPVALFYLAGVAILAMAAGWTAKPLIEAKAGSITTKGEAEAKALEKGRSETEAINIAGGLYQKVRTEETGKERSPALESLGGGIGGQPSISKQSGEDVTTGAKGTGTQTADTANAFNGVNISSFMPLLQLIVIGILVFMIIKEVT